MIPETAARTGRDEVLRLFLQHQVMLSGFLYSLVEDWEFVEEALQETAVFVCGRWQDFAAGTDFGAWARSVAHMRCREVLRAKRRGAAAPEPVADPVTAAEWDEHGEFTARQKEALSRCVRALPEPHRRVVELHYLDRLPCDRVARALRRSVDSVYMALSRIRKRLRECVGHRLARGTP